MSYGRERVGHDGVAFRPLHVLTECPVSFITDESRSYLDLFGVTSQFEGALPEAGGFFDQPTVVMEILATIKHEVRLVQEYLSDVADAKAERERKAKERQQRHNG